MEGIDQFNTPILDSANNLNKKSNFGTKLADFNIICEIGKGSFGTVYKVQSNLDKCEYVLKKISIKHLKPKQIIECMKEVEILQRVSHENIIQYYTSFIEEEHLHIVMEYAQGGDLYTLIKIQKEKRLLFSENNIWDFAYQLCQGINYLHSNNILHRDIKTLNLLLTKDLKIKIADMGVSKIVQNNAALLGTRVGTPLYLAPEQVRQQPYDMKVDVWAVGCVIYHLTCLEMPFSGDNLISLGYNIVHKIPKAIPGNYSKKLQDFILLLLEKLPANRPKISDVFSYFPSNYQDKGQEKINQPKFKFPAPISSSISVLNLQSKNSPDISRPSTVVKSQSHVFKKILYKKPDDKIEHFGKMKFLLSFKDEKNIIPPIQPILINPSKITTNLSNENIFNQNERQYSQPSQHQLHRYEKAGNNADEREKDVKINEKVSSQQPEITNIPPIDLFNADNNKGSSKHIKKVNFDEYFEKKRPAASASGKRNPLPESDEYKKFANNIVKNNKFSQILCVKEMLAEDKNLNFNEELNKMKKNRPATSLGFRKAHLAQEAQIMNPFSRIKDGNQAFFDLNPVLGQRPYSAAPALHKKIPELKSQDQQEEINNLKKNPTTTMIVPVKKIQHFNEKEKKQNAQVDKILSKNLIRITVESNPFSNVKINQSLDQPKLMQIREQKLEIQPILPKKTLNQQY